MNKPATVLNKQLDLALPPRVCTPYGKGFVVKQITERLYLVRFDGVHRLCSIDGCTLIVLADEVEAA